MNTTGGIGSKFKAQQICRSHVRRRVNNRGGSEQRFSSIFYFYFFYFLFKPDHTPNSRGLSKINERLFFLDFSSTLLAYTWQCNTILPNKNNNKSD